MRKIIVLLLLAVAGLLFLKTFASDPSRDIYVATDGNDAHEGSKAKPFRTLKKAATEAKAGTTVHIREGVYEEKLVVKHSGTKANRVYFQPYKKEKVILSGKTFKDEEADTAMITIDDKNYVTIRGLVMQDLTTELKDETVMGIFVTGSSSHITLAQNDVRRIETTAKDGNAHGIAVYGEGAMTDITITNNSVEDLKLGTSEAVVLNGNIDGFRIESNSVHDTDNIGIDLIGYEGISSDAKADFVRNGVVRNNHVQNISTKDNPSYGGEVSAAGIYVDGGRDVVIQKNTIAQSDIGIEATSEHAGKYAENIKIIDNTVYENVYTGISIGGYDENRGGTKNTTIARNILYHNDTRGLDGGQILLQHDVTDNVISDNILTAGTSRIFIANFFTTNKHTLLRRNVFHKEEGKGGKWIWKEEEYTSFQTFKKASHSDRKSSYIDPGYVDAKAYDFRLKKHSRAKEIISWSFYNFFVYE